jgi:hypothetical protein
MPWDWVATIGGGLAVCAIIRPWRLFFGRNHCPQCEESLTWWGRLSWKDEWDCPRCGCQIGQ